MGLVGESVHVGGHRAHVEECTDADESSLSQMQAKLQYIGIDRLTNHIGKKVRVTHRTCPVLPQAFTVPSLHVRPMHAHRK